MAIYYARKSGNVNAADVWATTPTGTAGDYFSSFTNQDSLIANSFSITLNVNTTVLDIRNDATGGATASGGFTIGNGITLNGNVFTGSTSSACLTCSSTNDNIATVNGNITIGNASAATHGISHSSSGMLYVNGNITANSSTSGSYGLVMGNNSKAVVTGNISGGNGATLYGSGISFGSSASLVVNGTIIPNMTFGIYITGAGSVTINGTVYGPYSITNIGSAYGVVIANNNVTVTINGNVIGGAFAGLNSSAAVVLGSTSTNITIVGTVIGGSANQSGVYNNNIGTITIIGSATGGLNGPGVLNNSTGTVIVTRAKGNGFGPGSVGMNSVVGVAASQTSVTKVYEIEYGQLGQSPTSGPIEMVTANSNVAVFAVRFSSKKTLVDLNNSTNLIPASGNVRSGISYNYGNNTGSCVIPNANSVVYGVPVDNTVGSGLLSPVAVWNALTSSIATSGSIGERLKNCSTVSTVGKQLEGVL